MVVLSWVPALRAGQQNQSLGTKPIPEMSLFSPFRFLNLLEVLEAQTDIPTSKDIPREPKPPSQG